MSQTCGVSVGNDQGDLLGGSVVLYEMAADGCAT